MAVKYVIDDETMTQIADPLRSLAGREDELTPAEMAAAGNAATSEVNTQTDLISQIQTALEGKASPGGGITPSGTIEITENGTYDVTNYAEAVVDLPTGGGGDTSLEDALIQRTLTQYVNDRVTSVGYGMFYDNHNLTKLHLPNVKSIAGYGLYCCSNLSDHDFSSLETLGDHGMSRCESLGTLHLPHLTSAGQWAFSYFDKTAEIIFPKLTSLGVSAFRSSSGITKIDIGGTLTGIGGTTFYGCSKLDALILRSTTLIPLTASNVFTSSKIASKTGYIYVPSALVDSYKAATNWSTHAAQFRAIEDYPDITGG